MHSTARRLYNGLLRCLSPPLYLPIQQAACLSTQQQQQQQQAVSFLRLNNLQDNPGAVQKKRRVGRGIGSSKGKTSGRGHKGQKARSGGSIHPTFEGGQTRFFKLLPKRGFNNARHETLMLGINLGTIQTYIDMGRLDANRCLTLYDLQRAGLFKPNAIQHGVKLLGDGAIKQPVMIQCSRASQSAIRTVEQAGGFVTTMHYNQLALRALLRPQKFVRGLVPRQARPPPKLQPYYTSWKNRGYLNPVVQMRQWLDNTINPSSAGNDGWQDKFERILAEKQIVEAGEKE
jgi:large subunit ribosomal protein L15